MQDWISQYFKGLSQSEYYLQIGILFGVLFFLLHKLWSTYHRFRMIKDTATSKIASAAQGYVELVGLGEMLPGANTTSPFSSQRCLWYLCVVEKRKHDRDNDSWELESSEISDDLFLLQDETGVCIIIPDGAHVVESRKTVWYGNTTQARYKPQTNTGLLSKFLSHGDYRFTEKLIAVADSLYVTGVFETTAKIIHPDALKQHTKTLVQTWKTNPSRYLSAYDQDANGKINDQEWKRIYADAELEIADQQEHTVHHTLKKSPYTNQPFIISALLERDLLNKKRGLIAAYLVVFFPLLYILITALKVH